MRILTVINHLGPGGTQRVAQNYSVGYRQAGHDVAVLAYVQGGPRQATLEDADILTLIGGTNDQARQSAIAQAVQWNPDLVHIHRTGYTDPESGRLLQQLKQAVGRLPVLETNVFARVDYSPDRELIDVHLLLTRWCLWKWEQWQRHIQPMPIGTIVPYTIDTHSFYPPPAAQRAAFRAAHGIPDDAFLFGRIGQPSVWKWSPIIFDAYREIAQRYPHTYLLLVGLPPELRPRISSLPANIQERVVEIDFLHGDEALRQGYSAMDAFLHAAHIGESFGMVLVESMLCGCPVITLSTPHKDNSQLEVVGHEEGGLVVTDRASMVEAMSRMVEHAPLRQQLARRGADRVRERYDFERVISLLLRTAEIARQATSREEIRRQLRADSQLVTHVSDAEIRSLLRQTTGQTPLSRRLLMQLVHQPHLYRLWQYLKPGA